MFANSDRAQTAHQAAVAPAVARAKRASNAVDESPAALLAEFCRVGCAAAIISSINFDRYSKQLMLLA